MKMGWPMDSVVLILSIALVHFTVVVTPGANFLVVTKNALAYSRQTGVQTALGSLIYVMLGFLGFAAVLSQSPMLLTMLRFIGAAYFAYMGYSLLISKPKAKSLSADDTALSQHKAFQGGLLTSLSNPAAPLYFMSLFTTFIPVDVPFSQKIIIALVLPLISLTWYTLMALTFSTGRIQQFYARFERPMNLAFGVLWLGLSVKLALG
jgi:threonine/homoserine/homoserine lactone efflux protein